MEKVDDTNPFVVVESLIKNSSVITVQHYYFGISMVLKE